MIVGLLLDMGPVYTSRPWFFIGIFLLLLQTVGGVFIFLTKLTYLPFIAISESDYSHQLITDPK